MADPTEQPLTASETARRRFVEDFAKLLDDAQFRRWLWFVIDEPGQCKTHGLSVDLGNADRGPEPLRAYYQEGRRSVGLALSVTAQKVAPTLYLRMLTEAMGLRAQAEQAQK